MDRNGYNPSLFETEDGTCYLCGFVGDTARHEVLHGPNRENSKKHGLWICVCPRCHDDIHREDNGLFLWLKEAAQELWECAQSIGRPQDPKAMIRKEFMAIFGRNYIE